MNKIDLVIKARSPLSLGKKKPGSVSEAENYIRGSVIRGAIASVMLNESGQQNRDLSENGGDFQEIFLGENAAIFHNAYPNQDQQSEVQVLPATTFSSKDNPGFRPSGNGVFDTLIDRFCAEGHDHPYDPNCPTDGDRVEPYQAFYTCHRDKYKTYSVSKRLLTRVGINRRRATAEEDILYSLEVLNESQKNGKEYQPATYTGSIFVENDAIANKLIDFINHRSFRLGGATSRGLGKVDIQANRGTIKNDISSRINKFNKRLHNRWQEWSSLFGEPENSLGSNERTYFTVDLQSDAILKENWIRTTVISENMLQEYAGVRDSSLQLHVAYSSYDYLSGWNAAWGRMKDIELITNQSAVYLYSTTNPDLWESGFQQLETKGVGDRTNEGFGQLQICHPFHLILWEEAK